MGQGQGGLFMTETQTRPFFQRHAKLFIALTAMLLAYAPTIIWMWDRWNARDTYYSHGILIPLVSLYLIWQQKDQLNSLRAKESPFGLPLIIFGLALHMISSPMRIYFSSGFSMLIVLFGIVLHLYGSAILRKVAFALFFLIFMIPLPLVVIINLSFKLKIFAAMIAEKALNQMGIPAVREGSIIMMRTAQVVVDDVCSGLRSLISLTALGSIFAYWLKGNMAKRITLFLMTIPIAVITNVCRVIILSCVSEIWGPQYAQGFVHDATGYMVFALAFILLFATSKVLE